MLNLCLKNAINEDFLFEYNHNGVLKKPSGRVGTIFFDKRGNYNTYKQKIMEKWSAKDYNGVSYPSDKLF
jgi:adenosine deaminase/adenosine deaminase CECR1